MSVDFKKYPILYVDDELPNRIVLEQNFCDRYTILLAGSGEEALSMLHEHQIAVLLTDHKMPQMTGVDLAERFAALEPDIVRIILTAFGDMALTVDAINRGQISRFIQKPWNFELLDAVFQESILTYYNRKHAQNLQMRLFDMERVASVGLAVAGAIHDLRQANGIISNNLRILDKLHNQISQHLPDLPPVKTTFNDINEASRDIQAGFQMLQKLLDNLLNISRPHEKTNESFDVVEVVNNAVLLSRTNILRRGRLRLYLPQKSVHLNGSSHRLLQLLNNLLFNACQAFNKVRPVDNQISVSLKQTDTDVLLCVADTGKGMTPEVVASIFDPFFTTKGKDGSGLGLAICKEVTEEFGGSITCESELDKGTTFTIVLPRQRPQASK